MLIQPFPQPGAQCAELAYCDLTRDIGICFDGGSVELRAENVADSIALKSTTDAAGIPMDVLQAAISIVGGNYSKIGLHTCAPGL